MFVLGITSVSTELTRLPIEEMKQAVNLDAAIEVLEHK